MEDLPIPISRIAARCSTSSPMFLPSFNLAEIPTTFNSVLSTSRRFSPLSFPARLTMDNLDLLLTSRLPRTLVFLRWFLTLRCGSLLRLTIQEQLLWDNRPMLALMELSNSTVPPTAFSVTSPSFPSCLPVVLGMFLLELALALLPTSLLVQPFSTEAFIIEA